MAVNIFQVAKAAGVSVATVSRVFNDYSDISEKTKDKVLRVATKLGYAPSIAARTLSSKTLKTIALIINDVDRPKFDVITIQLIKGVYEYTQKVNTEFVFYMTNSKLQHTKTFEQFCVERNISGAVVQGLNTDDPYIAQISQSRVPVVSIDIDIPGGNTASISIDNRKAEATVTRDMLTKGKRNLVLINGWSNAEISVYRQLGFCDALLEFGLNIQEYTVQYANFNQEMAKEITRKLLIQYPKIDGFVCVSDAMALGVIESLKSLKRKIPGEVFVSGFDNTIASEYVYPTLSTVEQHMDLIAFNAASLVEDMIDNKLTSDKGTRRFYTDFDYIQRGSTMYGDKQ